MKTINGIPRRNRIDLNTPAEMAIRHAMAAVESAGAHPLLTDAVMLLGDAHNKVADFVELDDAMPSNEKVSHSAGRTPESEGMK